MVFTAIEFINFGIGLLFMVLGYLVSIFPDLIAGYNTMDAKSKEKFDIDGFKKLMKISFIGAGIVIILCTLILSYSSSDLGKLLVSIIPGIALSIFLNIRSKSYFKS